MVFHGAFPGWEAEHAGVVETSLMLRLDPDRVLVDRIPPPARQPLPTYTILPEPVGLVPAGGVLASAVGSSAEVGRQLVERLVGALERILRAEFGERIARPS